MDGLTPVIVVRRAMELYAERMAGPVDIRKAMQFVVNLASDECYMEVFGGADEPSAEDKMVVDDVVIDEELRGYFSEERTSAAEEAPKVPSPVARGGNKDKDKLNVTSGSESSSSGSSSSSDDDDSSESSDSSSDESDEEERPTEEDLACQRLDKLMQDERDTLNWEHLDALRALIRDYPGIGPVILKMVGLREPFFEQKARRSKVPPPSYDEIPRGQGPYGPGPGMLEQRMYRGGARGHGDAYKNHCRIRRYYWKDLLQLPQFTRLPIGWYRCDFCSLRSHTRLGRDGTVLCPSLRRHQGEQICSYVLCWSSDPNRPGSTRSQHFTSVCPALHQRCESCLYRGHSATMCPGRRGRRAKRILECLRDIFHRYASEGQFTRLASGDTCQRGLVASLEGGGSPMVDPAFGFQHLPINAYRGTLSYARLRQLPLELAERAVAAEVEGKKPYYHHKEFEMAYKMRTDLGPLPSRAQWRGYDDDLRTRVDAFYQARRGSKRAADDGGAPAKKRARF